MTQDAQSRPLITALTVMSVRAFPRAFPSHIPVRETSVWTQQEGVSSHIIWETQKHKHSPLIEASLHHNLGQEPWCLCSLCRMLK